MTPRNENYQNLRGKKSRTSLWLSEPPDFRGRAVSTCRQALTRDRPFWKPEKSRLNSDLDAVNGWTTPCTDTAIMHRPAIARLANHGPMALAELPPLYLAPSLHFSMTRSLVQTSSFSTTPAVAARHGRDMNRTRGVSAIHRTGTRFNLSASKYPLPKPVSPEQMKARPATPNHGLWGFFPPTHDALSTTEYDAAFGKFTGTHLCYRILCHMVSMMLIISI